MNTIQTEVVVEIIPGTKPVKIVEPTFAKTAAEPIITEKVIRKVHKVTAAQTEIKKGIVPLRLVLELQNISVTAHYCIASPT